MTTSTTSTRRRLKAVASLALIGIMTLGGCGSTGTDTARSVSSSPSASSSATTTSVDASTTAQTIAEAFVATLSQEQRDAVQYTYDDETKTTSWSNLPVTFVQRAGLNLAHLSAEQQAAALKVLEALLTDVNL